MLHVHVHVQEHCLFRSYACLCASAYARTTHMYANSPVELSTDEQIDMQFHWRKMRESSFNCIGTCTYVHIQVRTHQRRFRQMIVSGDAINQRQENRKTAVPPTFEFERQSNRLSWFGWHIEVLLSVPLGREVEEKLLGNLVHIFHSVALHSPNARQTESSRSFKSFGWIAQVFSRLLLLLHVCVFVFFVKLWETLIEYS